MIVFSFSAKAGDDFSVTNKVLKRAYKLYDQRDKNLLNYCDSLEQTGLIPQGEVLYRLYTLKSRMLLDYSTADSAQEYLIRAKEIKDKYKISKWAQAHWEMNYGWYIFNQNKIIEAKKVTLTALAKFKQLKDSVKIAGCYSNLGAFYLETNEYEEALKCFNEAEEITRKLKNYRSLGIVLNNLGIIYLDKGDFDKSISIFNQGIEAYNKVNANIDLIITIKSNLAKALLLKGETEKSLKLGNELYKESMSNGYRPSLPYICSNLAYGFLELNKVDSAIHYAQIGLNIANELQFLSERISLLYAFYDIYEQRKEFKNALEVLTTIDSLKATLIDTSLASTNKESNFMIEKINEQENFIKRLQVLKENEEELKEGRTKFIYFTILGILVTCFLLFYLLLILNKTKRSQVVLNSNNNIIEQQNDDLRQQTDFQLMLLNFIGNDLRNPLGELLNFESKLQEDVKDRNTAEAVAYSKLMFHSIQEMYLLSNSIVEWAKNIDKHSSLNIKEINAADFQLLLSSELTKLTANYFQLEFNEFPKCNLYIDPHSILISLRNVLEYTFKEFLKQNAKISVVGKQEGNQFQIIISHEMQEYRDDFDFNLDDYNLKVKFSNSLGLLLIKSILEMNKCTFNTNADMNKCMVFTINFTSS